MPIRYMGTKRHLASHIQQIIAELRTTGRTVDLFSGIGAVSESLEGTTPIIANDLLQFTNCIARARFTMQPMFSAEQSLGLIYPAYSAHLNQLAHQYRQLLRREAAVLARTAWQPLADYMADVPHVGSHESVRFAARSASSSTGPDRYQLTNLYFAGSYLSLRQAIQVDALRYAISVTDHQNDIVISNWLGAVNDALNAPGHTANYIHAHSDSSAQRIRRAWRADIWALFARRMYSFRQVGSTAWRRLNRVTNMDARLVLKSNYQFSVVYADPPYTKDHYSRYYHLYETLYLYDYPDSTGVGRYRGDRFVSDFSKKTAVSQAFTELFLLTAQREVPLVLSYPGSGLLYSAGSSVGDIANQYFDKVSVYNSPADHSTFGGRRGHSKKPAIESIYVCTP